MYRKDIEIYLTYLNSIQNILNDLLSNKTQQNSSSCIKKKIIHQQHSSSCTSIYNFCTSIHNFASPLHFHYWKATMTCISIDRNLHCNVLHVNNFNTPKPLLKGCREEVIRPCSTSHRVRGNYVCCSGMYRCWLGVYSLKITFMFLFF